MKKILICILMFICISINAQDYCGTEDCEYSPRSNCERLIPNGWSDSLLFLSNFIPSNDTFPIISIKVNVHIFRRDDGTGNRWLDTEEYRDSLRMMFDYANYISSNNCQYSEDIQNAEFIPDTKYRFILDSVYYYNNTILAYCDDNNPINNYLLENYPERLNNYALHMNLFDCDYSGISTVNGNIQSCLFVKCYTGRYSSLWADAQLFNHEIGHNLGLRHPYSGSDFAEERYIPAPEFLWDLFGTSKQSWCHHPKPDVVCYHDTGWDCDLEDPSTTCTNNIMGGNKEARHFTALQCGRIHRALRTANIRKHAYGYTSVPKVVYKDEHWDFNYKSYQDIIVNPNVTLTISCRLEMVSQAKIIIKPGGKLIVDGGTITKAHHEGKWQGIEVWGVDSLNQDIINGQCQQAYLVLKNGATIENAICAVNLCNPADEHGNGGVVQATDAVFRNNSKSIRATDYSNYSQNPNVETANVSSFNQCSFTVDEDYIGDETFHSHVELSNVDGIKFYACSFSVDNDVPQVSSSSSAITAYNAGFSVEALCDSPVFPCPESSKIRSSFDGFNKAVSVTNSGGVSKTFSINSSSFNNNEIGIYAENTGYATIIMNDFMVGTKGSCNYGIYLDHVTNFCIEENTFSRDNYVITLNKIYGIAVKNSASFNDIYLNHFSNLYCGVVAIGSNKIPGHPNYDLGLTYTCNTNYGNTNDIGVLRDGIYGNIDGEQGSNSVGAGNTFSASNYHFYHNGINYSKVKYYYHGSGNKIPTRRYNVTIESAISDNDCLSHYSAIPPGPGGELMSVITTDSLGSMYTLTRVTGNLVRNSLNEEERDYDELREWLGKANDMNSDRMIVASYIQQGDFDNASSYAKTLVKKYALQGAELDEHLDYMEIISLHESLYETQRSVKQLTDYEKAMLEDMAENGVGGSQLMARSILDESRGTPTIIISSCPTIPTYGASVRGESEEITEPTSDKGLKVEVSPNPATSSVEISYVLPEKEKTATFVLTNTLGVNVLTTELEGNNGVATINLDNIPSGIYFYTVRSGDDVMTGKLVVE